MISKTAMAAMLLTLGATISAGCGGSARLPSDTVAVVTPLSLGPPPIYALIGYRDELELSSDQIAGLDEVAQQLEETNMPLVKELQGTTSRTRQGGQLVVRSRGEALLIQIRDNQTRAVESVGQLLSEEQRAEVCRLYAEPGQDEERESSRRPGGPDERVEDQLARPVGWNWCSEEGPANPPELRAGPN